MLRGRKWLLIAVSLLLVVGIATTILVLRNRPDAVEDEEEEGVEAAKAAAEEAPPDLQKLRDSYKAGIDAVGKKDGPAAVRHLSSFTFGPRAVEEYRLYYLANAYQLAGNSGAARQTLAKLWRRSPRLVHAHDVASKLAKLYAENGDATRTADVYAALARREGTPREVIASARWNAILSRLQGGDVGAALYQARNMFIYNPRSEHAPDAAALIRALLELPQNAPIPLTPSERVDRAIALMQSEDSQTALEELTALEPRAPQLRDAIRLQRGVALSRLKRYEESNKVLEPLTSGYYKYAIPALRQAARNYAVLASAINPITEKTVKERKQVGTVKQKVGKGKKRRTVTKPKYQTVFRKVKLVDLPKKQKKDEYERLASERLKDILQIEQIDPRMRLDVLNALAARAQSKNQDPYLQELVPQIVKLDSLADPALQHFWDKGWAAYSRGDLGTARKLFRFIADTYTHPNVRRQSEYWFARSIERQGQKEEAAAIYQKLASAPYEDLYALHSVSRGAKPNDAKGPNPLKKEGDDWRELAEKQMPQELQLAYELTALSAMKEASLELRQNSRPENTRFAEALMADVHHTAGNEIAMYRSLRKAWPQLATVEQDSVPVYFIRMYYPIKYGEEIEKHAKTRKLDPNLVRGLILQESYYNRKAKSRVGATGLMQLMPPTAKEHARRMRISFAVSRLEDPDVNVRLGTYHLRMLVDMFRGNTYLAVASYNAGQGNVLKWRRAAPKKPIDEMLESIPFPETRNYVKRVTMLRSAYSRLTS
ncbi:MAG TPA: transglycosylase SLT domain-containing protein [Thermoanaerobaculia bacterium]|nr:transglycosylase SLT domain-containing protein [Thermoanaerobaculia bacterium]